MDAPVDGWLAEIAAANALPDLDEVERKLLGKTGTVTELVKGVAALPREQRPEAGRSANQTKVAVQAAVDARREELESAALAADLGATDFDPTSPGLEAAPGSSAARDVRQPVKLPTGTLHPISQVSEEVTAIFAEMGFSVAEGPRIDTDWYNFAALDIPVFACTPNQFPDLMAAALSKRDLTLWARERGLS